MNALKISFALLISACVMVSSLLFLSWNSYKTVEVPSFDDNKDFTSIDSCYFNEKFMTVKGWALNPEHPNNHAVIYARKNKSDEWVVVKSSIVSRPDVSRFFKVNSVYDRSGFEASIRNISLLGGLSGEIAVIINEDKVKARGIRYECK